MKKIVFRKSLVCGIVTSLFFISIISIADSQQLSINSIRRSAAEVVTSTKNIRTATLENGSLSGYVTDVDMNPIEDALVRVYFHETYKEDYSDSNGYYHVTDIPICYCMKEAVCSKAGYYNESAWLSITENTTYDFVLIPIDIPCYAVLDGVMGDNGWYVSCVNISFVISGPLDALFYKIDGGSWQTYTAPVVITICEDGAHTFMWRYIYQENESATFAIDFKIDKTPPEVTISKERISFNKIKITVDADDPTSGINRAEFYLNDILQGMFTTPPPYVIYVLLVGLPQIITIIIYDNAGNSVTSKTTTLCSQNNMLRIAIQNKIFLFQPQNFLNLVTLVKNSEK